MRAILTALLLLPSSLPAQVVPSPAPRRHSIIMEAQSVANGGAARLSSDAASQNTTVRTVESGDQVPVTITQLHDQQRTDNAAHIQVTIRNLATTPDHLTLEWYFVATPVGITARQPGAKDFVFDQGSQGIDLHPGPNPPVVVSSKAIQSVIVRSATVVKSNDDSVDVTFPGGHSAIASSVQSGVKMKGWFVRVLDGARVVAVQGSSANFEDIAKDDSKLKAFLANPKLSN